ncbi:MAG TPA: hypothetical protein VEQ85_13500 [Lacipirellulaceae bacterium]|nr:hypothetical protein [Lacipirellulaceae bacterium]
MVVAVWVRICTLTGTMRLGAARVRRLAGRATEAAMVQPQGAAGRAANEQTGADPRRDVDRNQGDDEGGVAKHGSRYFTKRR